MTRLTEKKGITFACLVAVFFVIFGATAQLANSQGWIYGLVRQSFSTQANRQMEQMLWLMQDASPAPLVIGDARFVEKMLAHMGTPGTKTIVVGAIHPNSLSFFFQEIDGDALENVYLQLSPELFSDLRFREGSQRFEFWNAAHSNSGYWPRGQMKLLFELPVIWAKARWDTAAVAEPQRLEDFGDLAFAAESRSAVRLGHALEPHVMAGKNIVWVADPEGYTDEIIRRFLEPAKDQFQRANHTFKFGTLATFSLYGSQP